jgi:polygalacturonase
MATFCAVLLGFVGFAFSQSTMTAPPAIAAPMIPPHRFNIRSFGAVDDGTTPNTAAINRALSACQSAGGGTVEIPEGRFLTGPFKFFSGLNLQIDDGATLVFSDNPRDYPIVGKSFENFIQATDCHDIAITGTGTINGQGASWWKNFVPPKTAPNPLLPRRPFLVVLQSCRRVLVRGITLLNSPNFNLVPADCTDVRIDHVRISAPEKSPNTDGIDLSGDNCVVTGCTIDNGDDNLVMKPSAAPSGQQFSCENIWIEGCTFLHGHGISIGSQTRGGLRNMMVRDCTFDGTLAGIRMKANRGIGGTVEDITYEHLRMKHVKVAVSITSYYPKVPPKPESAAYVAPNDRTPIWRHILIKDVVSEDGDIAGQLVGLPEMPISDIGFEGVSLSAAQNLQIIWASGIRFSDSRIQVGSRPAIIVNHSSITGIDPVSGGPGEGRPTTAP